MKLLYNAKIHTLDSNQPVADALVINHHLRHEGRIIAVGSYQQLQAEFGSMAKQVNLGGRTVLPGLTDSHIHLRQYANALQSLNLFGSSKQACLDKVAQKAAQTPPGTWIQGYGWSQDNWDGQFPTAADLDAVTTDHPVLLMAVSLHAVWVNSAALKAAGITATTPDPPKGIIQRDPSGEPTGLLLEEAMKCFDQLLPSPTAETTLAQYEHTQEHLWRMGITAVHDFDRIPSFITLQTLHSQGRLKLRVNKNLPVESLDTIIESGMRSGLGDHFLKIGSIKAFADGALGPRTAAMLEPYQDSPNNRGMLLLDAEGLVDFGQKAVQNGLSLTVHAIGDAANHQILNGFEQLRRYEREHHLPHLRHRIEHVQLLHPADTLRLSQLDLIASMQPIHATSDMKMADAGWGDRSRYAYAWRTLLKANTKLTFGSDAPVDSPNPFYGLHAAVSRKTADGEPGPEGWYSEEKLSLMEALQAYTSGPAYTSGMEDHLGVLAPGFLADLIVLDQDPFTLPVDDLRHLKPSATMLGGDWVFSEIE
jgi:predicted amidohydrolase YtcJ